MLQALGCGPNECSFRIVHSGADWRLRDYGVPESRACLLIVAAPIKRPYIWDLSPDISAIRSCLRHGLHVYLLEWMPPLPEHPAGGIDDCAQAIGESVAAVTRSSHGSKPVLIGHSLGGTLAAIYAAAAPESIRALVLLSAPLCFRPGSSRFRDALVALVPPSLSETEPYPGSLLSQMSALASPGTFIWSRLMDAALSATDRGALELHARVERWALDEVPLAGKLVHEIIDWLYREDRFCRGELQVRGRRLGPGSLSAPVLVVANTSDEVAAPNSVRPFEQLPNSRARIIEYAGETGVCLQHLGILVGRQARAQVWPEILDWMSAQR
jgi:polyhydroxyalkanoate synthase